MGSAVYALCALTSIVCSILLLRGFFRRRTRLLLWSSIAFVGLAVNNALLFVDLVLVPETDLSGIRGLCAFAAVMVLVFGLVWDSE